MKKFVIFDIDGCISDDRHRRKLLPEVNRIAPKQSDYREYHSWCASDKPINQKKLLEFLQKDFSLVFITGRPEEWRNHTIAWLNKHFGLVSGLYTLLMRPDDDDATPSPVLKTRLFQDRFSAKGWSNVIAAFDDRVHVLDAYTAKGVPNVLLLDCAFHDAWQRLADCDAADVLEEMAALYKQRNKVYGSNFEKVGPIMKVLFPDGVPADLLASPKFHLFELKIVKLTRFASSALEHLDSIEDDGVYSAMIAAIIKKGKANV